MQRHALNRGEQIALGTAHFIDDIGFVDVGVYVDEAGQQQAAVSIHARRISQIIA